MGGPAPAPAHPSETHWENWQRGRSGFGGEFASWQQLGAGGKEEAASEYRAALSFDEAETLQDGLMAVGGSGEQPVVLVGVSGGTVSCH